MTPNISSYKTQIQVASGAVILIGLLVIFGWAFDIPILKTVIPDYNSMKLNTALCFILVSISVHFQFVSEDRTKIFVLKSIGALVMLIGVLSFIEEISSLDLGIDQLFCQDLDSIQANQTSPGRMAAATSVCFIILGWFSLTLNSPTKAFQNVSQILLHVVTLISFISILGYFLDVPSLYKLSFITAMSIHTSVCLFIISLAYSLIHPSLGLMGLFTGVKIGNIMARRLFLQMGIVVLVLSYLRILSHRYHLVDVEFGIALFALSFILALLFLICITAQNINNVEFQRAQFENSFLQISKVLDSTPDPIIIIDELGNIQISNNQTGLVFGYGKEELVGRKVELLIPQRFKNRIEGLRAGFFQSSKTRFLSSGMDLFALRKDGVELPVEISLSPIELDGRTWVSASIRDISLRKHADEKFLQVSERLQLATQTSGIGIFDFDIIHNILVWDNTSHALYGIPKERFGGVYEAWKACLHPDDLEKANSEVQASIYGKKEFDSEFRVIWPDGSIHFIKSRAAIYRDSEGTAFRMLGTNWDITNLKKAEIELQESNERNSIFVQEAPNAIAMFDNQMRYMAASNKWYADYNLVGKEIIGRSHYEIFPEIGDDWKTIHRQVLQGNINQCDESYFERADGSFQWISWDVRPWYVSPDYIGGLIMYTEDITEQKRKEAEKRRIEEILDRTNEVARIGTWDVDVINQIIKWSRVTREIHEVLPGFEPNLETAIHFYKKGDSREMIQKAVNEAIDKGTSFDLELELITAKGNLKWVRAIGQTEFVNGRCKRMYGIFQDIDEIKKSKEVLNTLNLELQAIFNSGYVSMISTDENGLITHFNTGAETLLQYAASEMIGIQTPAIVHLDAEVVKRGQELSEMYGREIGGFDVFVHSAKVGEHESREWTYIRKDGSTFPVQLIVTAIKNKKGKITGFLGIATDITERKKTEEKLRNYSILESKSKEMEQFAYVASHDLREPLLTIKNYMELLVDEYGETLNDEGQMFAKEISGAANRMDELIKGLLDYSRLSSKKQLQDVDCNKILDDVLADIHSLIISTKASITVGSLPTLRAYPLELKLLFQNLLSNSMKFVKQDVAPLVIVNCHKVSHGWQFEVKDNGIGIEEKDREIVFQMFKRLHGREEYEGTGIGLAHCKKIVELHNGSIWIDSEPGKSCTFYFTILTGNS